MNRAWKFLLSGLILTALAIAFVDRPASSWSYHTFHGVKHFVVLTHFIDPIEPLALISLAVMGLAAAFSGWRPGPAAMTLATASIAVVVAIAMKDDLKYVFGRTWPETWVGNNPSWIGMGAYGFHFLHGGSGWGSFPSGHTTQMCALSGSLWNRLPSLRWLWILLPVPVVIGLFGADFHFIGDIIAGGYLGTSCGLGAHALLPKSLHESERR